MLDPAITIKVKGNELHAYVQTAKVCIARYHEHVATSFNFLYPEFEKYLLEAQKELEYNTTLQTKDRLFLWIMNACRLLNAERKSGEFWNNVFWQSRERDTTYLRLPGRKSYEHI